MKRQRRLGSALGLAVFLGSLSAGGSFAEAPALLVDDLVTSQPSAPSYPTPVAQLGATAFFTAEDTLHGRELWRTEGTPETTRLVADLCPGTCNSYPHVAVVGGRLFIYAADGASGALFTSDGSAAGTRLVRRFPDDPARLSSTIVAFDDRAWFIAPRGLPDHQYELWQSDGTSAGTTAWPLDCGPSCAAADTFLAAAGNEMFFGVRPSPQDGYQLWRTDGTVEGTGPAEPNCPPTCVELLASGIGVIGGRYYFAADDGVHGAEVWIAGGDVPAPHLVADVSPGVAGSYPFFGFEFGGAAWFRVTISYTTRWYRYTPAGAVPATELEPPGVTIPPTNVWPAGDRLYFTTSDGTSTTQSLWTVRPGIEAPRLMEGGLRTAYRVGEVGGRALIAVFRSADTQARLLVSDGTAAGTREIARLTPPLGLIGQFSPVLAGGTLIIADDGVHGAEPWVTDGTTAGTRPLGDLRQGAIGSPRLLTAVGDDVAFGVYNEQGDSVRAAGASGSSPPSSRTLLSGGSTVGLAASGRRLFAAHLPSGATYPGWELLAIDPATAAAQTLYSGEQLIHLASWRNGVAFGAYADGEPLWVSDGTAAGTQKLLDLAPGWSPFCPILCPQHTLFPIELTPIGDRLYLVATSYHGENLWTTDGTAPGTVPLLNTPPNVVPIIGEVTPFQGGVAFVRYGESTAVWTSRGTVESTRAVAAVSGTPQLLGAVGNRLVYSVDANGLDTLWATDGTAAGTALLDDLGGAVLRARVQSLRFQDFDSTAQVVAGERVFFVVDDDVAGEELWVSDGTAAGTRRVADLRPGPMGSHPRSLAAYRGCALFAATDGVAGYEPWASDGASAWRVADVAPGEAASTPDQFTAAGGFVYFTADDGTHGRELFAVATTELDARCAVQPPLSGPPPGSFISAAAPGFAFLVKIGATPTASTGVSAPCVNGTVCVTDTAGGRGDVFIRMVSTSAGRIAPAIVKLTPDAVVVTAYQIATGVQKVYQLPATVPPSGVLAGVLGRDAFAASAAASATFEPMTLLGAAPARSDAAAPARGGAGARWFAPRDIAGYRFKAWLVDANGNRQAVRAEGCLEGTLCLSGPVRGRTDVLVRVLDRRPAAARLTGTGLELWVERTKTHELRKYVLPAEGPTNTSLNGVLDPTGFRR